MVNDTDFADSVAAKQRHELLRLLHGWPSNATITSPDEQARGVGRTVVDDPRDQQAVLLRSPARWRSGRATAVDELIPTNPGACRPLNDLMGRRPREADGHDDGRPADGGPGDNAQRTALAIDESTAGEAPCGPERDADHAIELRGSARAERAAHHRDVGDDAITPPLQVRPTATARWPTRGSSAVARAGAQVR